MRTRPHIMLRSIIGAAFGLVITVTLVDPCAGQQSVTAPAGVAVGGNVEHSPITINNTINKQDPATLAMLTKALNLSSRSLGRRIELPLFRQGVTKGGFRVCVYAGAGSEAGSATDMIFLGVDMPKFFRISPRLSGIFVR